MNVKAEEMFNKLEQQRKEILGKVSRMPAADYLRAAENKWSVGQVITHLIVSEQLSVLYMKKKLPGIDSASDSGLSEKFKSLLLKMSQRLPIKYTAPAFILRNTPDTFPFEKAAGEWQHVRDDLKDLAGHVLDKNIRKKIFKHPVAGKLDLVQAMAFLYEHIRHHWPQIRRQL